MQNNSLIYLTECYKKIYIETLLLHARSPEKTRIASSLSPIEILVCLYYGEILFFDENYKDNPDRDRLILSKGHGSLAIYPILADKGFFSQKQLELICEKNSILGSIPDPNVPGIETINGSLGHGLGVSCGISIALEKKSINRFVFCLVGDGELNEGSVWEAIMFAGHNKLKNIIMIVDRNTKSMLGKTKDIISNKNLEDTMKTFEWNCFEVNGHDIKEVYGALDKIKSSNSDMPSCLICNTIKGKGISKFEESDICHVLSLNKEEIKKIIDEY